MTNDQEEVLELAKKCGAKIFHKEDGIHIVVADNHSSGNATQFVPKFAAALEEKHRAKIAMLVKVAIRAANKLSHLYAVMHLTDGFNPAQIASLQTIRAAIDKSISATQQDTDAFIAEVRAGERNRIATWMDANSISHISANWLRSPSAELRASAAQPEGKELK